jgi:hypothetical protein
MRTAFEIGQHSFPHPLDKSPQQAHNPVTDERFLRFPHLFRQSVDRVTLEHKIDEP